MPVLMSILVDDLGYVPRGKDWDSFVRLGNVVEDDDGLLKLSYKANGEHWRWPMNVSGFVLHPKCLSCHSLYRCPVAVTSHKQIDIVVVREAFATCQRCLEIPATQWEKHRS